MKPVGFEGALTVMRAPPNMSQEACCDMPVAADGVQVISCWRLDEADMAEIQRTGVVWLAVLGATTPPVKLTVHTSDLFDGHQPQAEPFLPIAPRTGE